MFETIGEGIDHWSTSITLRTKPILDYINTLESSSGTSVNTITIYTQYDVFNMKYYPTNYSGAEAGTIKFQSNQYNTGGTLYIYKL